MKKMLPLLAAMLLCTHALIAQAPKIEKSAAFDEPSDGWNKVLLLKNGNTFYFHFTKKEGIELTVYNPARKVIATKEITSDLWDVRKLRTSSILGLYEINGEPVLFLMQMDQKEPVVYRLRFNATRGNIVKEEEVDRLPRVNVWAAAAGLLNEGVVVEKDPNSNYYAIIDFVWHKNEDDKTIKVVHYNGSHKPVNVGYYDSPDPDFRELNLIGAIVDSDRRVFLCTYGASNRKGEDGHVYISKLTMGDSVFKTKTLDFTEDFRNTKSVFYYDYAANRLDLLTQTVASEHTSFFGGGTKRTYLSFLSFIDPETFLLKGVKPIQGKMITDYAQNTLKIDDDYHGLPQQMVINKDNTISILSEEMSYKVVRDSRGRTVRTLTNLGNIGISELNADGTEKKGYMISKLQTANGIWPSLYISDRSKGRWYYKGRPTDFDSYVSFDYINTDNNRYILFNDSPRNFDKDEDETSRKAVTGKTRVNTVCYSITADGLKKFYLFGDPEGKKESNSCYIEASAYQPSNDTYATVMVEEDGRDREAKLVWVTFP